MLGVLRRLRPSWGQARPFLIIGLLLLFAYFFFFWRLGSMTSGLGPSEYSSRQNSQDVEQIITRGLNAPFYLLQFSFTELIDNEVLALRLASVVTGLVIFTFFFLLLRSWFGQTVALFAGLLFVTTPWVIITARTATPNIMLLWQIAPLACFILMSRSKQRAGPWWLLLCLVAGLSLYTPGLIWFLLAGLLIAGRRSLLAINRVNGVYLVSGMTIAVLMIAPLAISLTLEPSRLGQLFLIPASWQSGYEALRSVGWSAASFFWSTRSHIDIGVGRLPILNILQIVLMIFGLYALSSRARNITYALAGSVLFSIIVSGLNDNAHLLILGLPAVAIFIAAGLRYLYIEWRRVFPLNPFARALAVSLLSLVVAVNLLYAGRYSLVAWQHTTETKSTYVLK
ncbi:MAG: glycosyltransferase family 39 protein [Candidatus Saccharimonadales bacterium]